MTRPLLLCQLFHPVGCNKVSMTLAGLFTPFLPRFLPLSISPKAAGQGGTYT
jgi:hypothetical protein